MEFESRNPSTEELLHRYPLLSDAALEGALARAAMAQKQWARLSLAKRIACIKDLEQKLRAATKQYGQLMQIEMGKNLDEGVSEIEKCATLCDVSTAKARHVLEPIRSQVEGGEVEIAHQPLGVIVAVMPWNFPFWQFFRAAIPTLLAGNVVLLKHAANTPQCALAIQALFDACSEWPIVQSLFINHDQLAQVIADKRVHGVTLTGSTQAGRAVATAAAAALKPCILELGGSDPFLVFEDADLEAAAHTAAASRCINNGQSCIAAKRFIVANSVFDRFAMLMSEAMRAKTLGPQATKAQQQILMAQVEDAKQKGAQVHCGGEVLTTQGYYYPATVLSDITPQMRVWHEEVFGPVACLFRFESDDEALKLANDTDFGLAATVFTRDKTRQERFKQDLDCGMVFVNEMVRSDPRFPFGGIKESGFGRELGDRAPLAFTNEKTIWINRA